MAINEAVRKTKKAMVVNIYDDYCFTPIGPKIEVVPYKIIAYFDASVREHGKVRFNGNEAITMNSRITQVIGNEPGVGGGVVSGVNRGYCRPITHSSTVRVNGHFVLYHSSQVWMNCNGPDGPGNCLGEVQYLSKEQEELILYDIERIKHEVSIQKKLALKKFMKGGDEEFLRRAGEYLSEFGDLVAGVGKYILSDVADTVATPYHAYKETVAHWNGDEYKKNEFFKYHEDVNKEIGETAVVLGKYVYASNYHKFHILTGGNIYPTSEEEMAEQPEILQWYHKTNEAIVDSIASGYKGAYERNGINGVLGRAKADTLILVGEIASGKILLKLRNIRTISKTVGAVKKGPDVDLAPKKNPNLKSGDLDNPDKLPESSKSIPTKNSDLTPDDKLDVDLSDPKEVSLVGKTEGDGVKITGEASIPSKKELNKLYSRGKFRKGVREEVWENAKGPDGNVRDPLTNKIMDPDEPWDMGHKPGYEHWKHQISAYKRGLTRQEFLDEYNDTSKYWPELPSSNRSHKLEDTSDIYFGDLE